jgi:hypothetical protein
LIDRGLLESNDLFPRFVSILAPDLAKALVFAEKADSCRKKKEKWLNKGKNCNMIFLLLLERYIISLSWGESCLPASLPAPSQYFMPYSTKKQHPRRF